MNTAHVELVRAQQERWQAAYTENPAVHGVEPSALARWVVERFGAAGIDDVLELGCGQGRDALYLARRGFSVHATDFSDAALGRLRSVARRDGLDDRVTAALHDARDPLPPADGVVDAVYANLLLSMAFSRGELQALVQEIHRILRPGGLFVWSVWSSADDCVARCPETTDGLVTHDGYAVRSFDRALIDELTDAWTTVEQPAEYSDGGRRLWRLSLGKS